MKNTKKTGRRSGLDRGRHVYKTARLSNTERIGVQAGDGFRTGLQLKG